MSKVFRLRNVSNTALDIDGKKLFVGESDDFEDSPRVRSLVTGGQVRSSKVEKLVDLPQTSGEESSPSNVTPSEQVTTKGK